MSSTGPLDPARAEKKPERRFALMYAILAGTLLGWWLFSEVAVPALIRGAHGWEALSLPWGLMGGRAVTPVEAYLSAWAGIGRGVMSGLAMLAVLVLSLALTLPSVATRIERRVGGTERSLQVILASLAVAGALLIVYLWYARPVAYVYAITEDYWVEYATFVAFLLASCLLVWAASLDRGLRRIGILALAIAAFLVSMDEISWGQRILGLETPDVLRRHNWQEEITLHNIWLPRYAAVGLIVTLYGAGVPFLIRRWAWLDGQVRRFGVPVPPPSLVPLFVVVGLLFLVSEAVPDYLDIGEVAEWWLGIAFVFLGLHVAFRPSLDRRPTPGLYLASSFGTLAATALVTAALVQWAPHPELLRYRLNDYAANRYPNGGFHDQAAVLFEYLERHPEHRSSRTRLDHGRLLLARGEEEEARAMLRGALGDLEHPNRSRPDDPDTRRDRLEIYRLLHLKAEAEAVYREALERDHARLAVASHPSDRARVHWSIARTMQVAGNDAGALRHAAIAYRLTDEAKLRRTIRRWAEHRTAGSAAPPSPFANSR